MGRKRSGEFVFLSYFLVPSRRRRFLPPPSPSFTVFIHLNIFFCVNIFGNYYLLLFFRIINIFRLIAAPYFSSSFSLRYLSLPQRMTENEIFITGRDGRTDGRRDGRSDVRPSLAPSAIWQRKRNLFRKICRPSLYNEVALLANYIVVIIIW